MARKYAASLLMLIASATWAWSATTGKLKLEVLGQMGNGARPAAQVFASNGKQVGEVTAGSAIDLPPGRYRLVLPAIGASIGRDDLMVEAGRTHTVLITNVAVLRVSVKDASGKDPGFGVTVTETAPPHRKLAEFLSGEAHLFAPCQVDVKVDAPPQGYYWHAVTLTPGRRANLELGEVRPADLWIKTQLGGHPIDDKSRVTIYRAGTQTQVAVSPPGPDHHLRLDPGDYDIYVQNQAGTGRPFVIQPGLHLDSAEQVVREIPLDGEATVHHGN